MRIMIYLTQLLRKADMFNSKDKNRLNNLENEINDLRHEIDFLHELLQPSPKELIEEEGDDYYAGTTTQIPADIYDKIVKYCENKNYIFMGIA